MAVTITLPEEISAMLAKRVACQRTPPDACLLQLLNEEAVEEASFLENALADALHFLESLAPVSADELEQWERDWQSFAASLQESGRTDLFSEARNESNATSRPRPNCP